MNSSVFASFVESYVDASLALATVAKIASTLVLLLVARGITQPFYSLE
jgi:hypothetical protein